MDVTVEMLKSAIVEHGHEAKLRELAAEAGLTEDEFLRRAAAGVDAVIRGCTEAMTALAKAFNDVAFQSVLARVALDELLASCPELEESDPADEHVTSTTG